MIIINDSIIIISSIVWCMINDYEILVSECKLPAVYDYL